MEVKKKIVKLVIPCALSCLMMGSALLHFPVQQSSAETIIESAISEKREDIIVRKQRRKSQSQLSENKETTL